MSLCSHLLASLSTEAVIAAVASSPSQQLGIVMHHSPEPHCVNQTGCHSQNSPVIHRLSMPKHESSHLSLIYPLVAIAVLIIVVISMLIYNICQKRISQESPKEKMVWTEERLIDEAQLHLCRDGSIQYEYKLVLRLGCPTALFDMEKGWIDVQLKEQDDAPIGQPVRFQTRDLTDRICGELIQLFGLMLPLPVTTGILANHSEGSERIFFYEYLLYNHSTDELIEVCAIHDYITSKPTIFRPIENQNEEYGLYPMLPEMEWNIVELANFGASMMLILGAFTMFIEWDNLYITNLQAQQGSMARSMFDVLYALPLICLLLLVIITGYKYNIKKKRKQAEYLIEGRNITAWTCASYAAHGTAMLLSIFSIGELVVFSQEIHFLTSLYWGSSFLIITVCAIGIWSMVEKSLHVRRYLDGIIAQETELALYKKECGQNYNLYKAPSMANTSTVENKTTYFTVKQLAPASTAQQQPTYLSAGPKLKNLKPIYPNSQASILPIAKRKSSTRKKLNNSSGKVVKRHSSNRKSSDKVKLASIPCHQVKKDSSVHNGRRQSKRSTSKVKCAK